MTSTIASTTASTSPAQLTRLLTHLEATLSSPSSSSSLRNSPAHRARIAANLEHARALHLTCEKSVLNRGSSASQRQAPLNTKEDVDRQREWIRKLEGRLRELGQNGVGDEEEDSESDSGDDDEEGREDLLRKYGPAREVVVEEEGGRERDAQEQQQQNQQSQSQPQQQSQQQQQPELRSRKGPLLSREDNRSAASTSARESLFSNRTAQNAADDQSMKKTETLMSHNRTEQEVLTTGLLGLAAALKQSSINFSSSLEAERDVLKRAEGGLDKSAVGMEAAGKKMGTLRRMSEGQGWWGRIKLYAFIFGLWVACFLLVFIGPKLRF